MTGGTRLQQVLDEFRSVPEQAFLLELSRPHLDDSRMAACRRILERGVRWDLLAVLSVRHGTMPLVCWNLAAHFEDRVPTDILQDWIRRSQEGVQRRLLLERELVLLMRDFEQEGIPALPFKGPTLARQAYGGLVLRPFEDLDILISPRQKARAKAFLLRRGARYRWAHLSPARERAAVRAQYHFEFSVGEAALPVELHWRFLPASMPDPFDPDQLLHRPEPEDLFLLLAAHAAKHRYARLIWLVDFLALIGSSSVRWEQLLLKSQRLGLCRALRVSLLLTRELLGQPLPDTVERRLSADTSVDALAAEAFETAFCAPELQDGGWREFQFLVRIQERWADRLRHLLRKGMLLFNPTAHEWDRFPLPDPLFFLYYGIRPLRLAGKYIRWR